MTRLTSTRSTPNEITADWRLCFAICCVHILVIGTRVRFIKPRHCGSKKSTVCQAKTNGLKQYYKKASSLGGQTAQTAATRKIFLGMLAIEYRYCAISAKPPSVGSCEKTPAV